MLRSSQKEHIKKLLRKGDELEAVRYLQNQIGLSAEEALKLTEQLDKTVEEDIPVKKKNKKVKYIVGGVFMFFGIIMLGVSIYIFYSNYKFANKAILVVGKVVDFSASYSTDDDGNRTLMYSGIFEYQYGEESFTHQSAVASSSKDYGLGEEVEILIDPQFPNKALVNTFWERWFAVILLGFLGTVFTGAGFMAYRFS